MRRLAKRIVVLSELRQSRGRSMATIRYLTVIFWRVQGSRSLIIRANHIQALTKDQERDPTPPKKIPHKPGTGRGARALRTRYLEKGGNGHRRKLPKPRRRMSADGTLYP